MDEDASPQIESKKERKLRLSKKYQTDVWEIIKNKDAGLTIGQVLETSTTARQMIRNGLTEMVKEQRHEVKEIAAVSREDRDSDRSTSAYASAMIETFEVRIIPDTGAAFSIIT